MSEEQETYNLSIAPPTPEPLPAPPRPPQVSTTTLMLERVRGIEQAVDEVTAHIRATRLGNSIDLSDVKTAQKDMARLLTIAISTLLVLTLLEGVIVGMLLAK